MARLIDTIRTVQKQKAVGGNFGAELAIVSRALISTGNVVKIDPDDLATTLSNLLASTGAAAAVSTLISGTDLTASGTLTTLATNVGAHTTQGATLRDALLALTANGTFAAKMAKKVIATPVAAAGSSASDAAALGSANILTISSDSAAKGVKLVAGVAGDVVDIINTSSTAAILYPATGGTINGLSANAGVLVPASKGTRAICVSTNTWKTYDMAAASTAA